MVRQASRWPPVIAACTAALLVAVLGATVTELGPWYQSLKQPAWKPADWMFGPAWTLIYGSAALAGVLAWREAATRAQRDWIVGLFSLNGTLNIVWSWLFFRFQRPDWALAEVGLLWLSIVLLIVVLGRWSKTAGRLLVPYLAWVTFAAALNLAVVRLNAPFGGG